MNTVGFHRLAANEYRSARTWYQKRDESVANRFRHAVDFALGRIIADADTHPVLVDDTRWVRVRRFPDIIVYVRESPDRLLVLAVAHVKRRPGYWKRRR